MTVEDYKYKGKWAYSRRVDGKRTMTASASVWVNMVRRCKGGGDNPSYHGCSLSVTFANFQTFTDWHVAQVGYGLGYHLDKDIIMPGNKVYSESTCVLVPRELNNFLCGMEARRGECPQGVTEYARGGYVALISVDSVNKYLGLYPSKLEAAEAYRRAKRQHAELWAQRLETEYVVDNRVPTALRKRDWNV